MIYSKLYCFYLNYNIIFNTFLLFITPDKLPTKKGLAILIIGSETKNNYEN